MWIIDFLEIFLLQVWFLRFFDVLKTKSNFHHLMIHTVKQIHQQYILDLRSPRPRYSCKHLHQKQHASLPGVWLRLSVWLWPVCFVWIHVFTLCFLARPSVHESTEGPGDHRGQSAEAIWKLATEGEWVYSIILNVLMTQWPHTYWHHLRIHTESKQISLPRKTKKLNDMNP